MCTEKPSHSVVIAVNRPNRFDRSRLEDSRQARPGTVRYESLK